MAKPDTDPACYRRGFARSDIGTDGKGRAKWGVSVKEYPLSKAPIAKSTYEKEWRCQERLDVFARQPPIDVCRVFHERGQGSEK